MFCNYDAFVLLLQCECVLLIWPLPCVRRKLDMCSLISFSDNEVVSDPIEMYKLSADESIFVDSKA